MKFLINDNRKLSKIAQQLWLHNVLYRLSDILWFVTNFLLFVKITIQQLPVKVRLNGSPFEAVYQTFTNSSSSMHNDRYNEWKGNECTYTCWYFVPKNNLNLSLLSSFASLDNNKNIWRNLIHFSVNKLDLCMEYKDVMSIYRNSILLLLLSAEAKNWQNNGSNPWNGQQMA